MLWTLSSSSRTRAVSPETIAEFSHSRWSHFALFDRRFRSVGKPDPATCDLKIYQDHLVHLFLRDNLPRGAKVLEVGGGDSRVLRHFARTFECWNVDPLEGLGNGPVALAPSGFRVVRGYLGTGLPELPDGYFDCAFSISALEHTPEDGAVREGLVQELQRVLKPGAHSFHLFDVVLGRPFGHWVNGLVPFLAERVALLTRPPSAQAILDDPDGWVMSKVAFERGWTPNVGEPYETYGRPASLNLYWANRPGRGAGPS